LLAAPALVGRGGGLRRLVGQKRHFRAAGRACTPDDVGLQVIVIGRTLDVSVLKR
jgi:hypothetical protein